ncbi:MAG: ribosomal protein L7/L12 [Phycisphaeraceae bacterium]|nr:ribosomal protein L7/L12 [Phycisphaeraceae bacterium]
MAGWFSNPSDPAVRLTLSRIERKLDALLERAGIQVPDDGTDELKELVRAGRKIEAIKIYRERTGMGLAEAKEFVDSL